MRHQNRFPWEAVNAPSLERLEAKLYWALSNLIRWKMSQLVKGVWTRRSLRVSHNPNHSMIWLDGQERLILTHPSFCAVSPKNERLLQSLRNWENDCRRGGGMQSPFSNSGEGEHFQVALPIPNCIHCTVRALPSWLFGVGEKQQRREDHEKEIKYLRQQTIGECLQPRISRGSCLELHT